MIYPTHQSDVDRFVVYILIIAPKNAPEASRDVTNSQFVLPFDFGIWEVSTANTKLGLTSYVFTVDPTISHPYD
jgi:hypothetical protein